jgi:predicted transcriptional regulator
MKELTKEEKLKKVIELAKKHDISAHEIAKNTDLNASGVHKILKEDNKNPRTETIDKILFYLTGKTTQTNSQVNEPPVLYGVDKLRQELSEVTIKYYRALEANIEDLKIIGKLKRRLEENNIDYSDITPE